MSLGSWSMSRIRSSSVRDPASKPRALKLGLFQEKTSDAGRAPRIPRSSASVKGSLKKSRSSSSAPPCERNSLALRQLDQRAHQ